MDKGSNKTFLFLTALSDCYKDGEERELFDFEKLQLKEEELTDDFTRMLIALHIFYKRITGDEVDLIGFTHGKKGAENIRNWLFECGIFGSMSSR